jgi:hypothetical protein
VGDPMKRVLWVFKRGSLRPKIMKLPKKFDFNSTMLRPSLGWTERKSKKR